jgi:hypothetical protein
MLRAIFMALVIMAAPCLGMAAAPEPLGTLTILEGEALVYRGLGRLHAVEGLRLLPGDILETAASAFAQVELVDRSVAGFGPSTRVLFNHSAGRQKAERSMYLMGGWAKLAKAERSMYLMGGWAKLATTQRDSAVGPGFDLRSPSIEIPATAAVVVMRDSAAALEVFAESGEPRVAERQSAGPAVAVPLRAGDFYTRKSGARGAVTASPARGFVADMPRSFRDSLPSRLERFRTVQVRPKDAGDFAYADVEAWLKAEPSVRRPLMQRWRAKAREPAFRSALASNLSSHPEWDPILFPEKYKPKVPSPSPVRADGVGPAHVASSPANTR